MRLGNRGLTPGLDPGQDGVGVLGIRTDSPGKIQNPARSRGLSIAGHPCVSGRDPVEANGWGDG